MDTNQKRIDRAWTNVKDWIADYDGSASQAYLSNIMVEALPQAIQALAQSGRDLRVSIVAGEGGEKSQFIQPETLLEHLAALQAGQIAGINANFTSDLDGQVVDLHLVLHTLGKRKVDVELVWWADQVFPEEVEARPRFEALARYFIGLQALFKAQKLYIGPETLERPGPGSVTWEEV